MSDFKRLISASSEKMACLSSIVRDKKGFGDGARTGEVNRSSWFMVVDTQKRRVCDDQGMGQLRGFERRDNVSSHHLNLILRLDHWMSPYSRDCSNPL